MRYSLSILCLLLIPFFAACSQKTTTTETSTALSSPEKTAEMLLNGGIDPGRRAETLTIPEWLELTSVYDKIRNV